MMWTALCSSYAQLSQVIARSFQSAAHAANASILITHANSSSD